MRIDLQAPLYIAFNMTEWYEVILDGYLIGPVETTNSMRIAEDQATVFAHHDPSLRAVVVKLDTEHVVREQGSPDNVESAELRDYERIYKFPRDIFLGLFSYIVGFYDVGPVSAEDPTDLNY